MSEIGTLNDWWKLEDSWKKIAKNLPFVFIPLIGGGLLLLPLLLIDFFKFGLFILILIISLIVILIGFIPAFIIFANQIGITVKLSKVKKTLPEESKYKKIFAYYLVSLLVPVVGPLFWSKSINNIMEYLGILNSIQEDIEYVESRGKIYGILGTILWVAYYASYIYYEVMRFLSSKDKVIITRAFLDFLIMFFSILGGIMLILGIIMVATQIGIINRLTSSIHNSGLY